MERKIKLNKLFWIKDYWWNKWGRSLFWWRVHRQNRIRDILRNIDWYFKMKYRNYVLGQYFKKLEVIELFYDSLRAQKMFKKADEFRKSLTEAGLTVKTNYNRTDIMPYNNYPLLDFITKDIKR